MCGVVRFARRGLLIILGIILGQVHHVNSAPLHLEQRLQIVKAKARESVPMRHHNAGDACVVEQS